MLMILLPTLLISIGTYITLKYLPETPLPLFLSIGLSMIVIVMLITIDENYNSTETIEYVPVQTIETINDGFFINHNTFISNTTKIVSGKDECRIVYTTTKNNNRWLGPCNWKRETTVLELKDIQLKTGV